MINKSKISSNNKSEISSIRITVAKIYNKTISLNFFYKSINLLIDNSRLY